jgi:quercetin dioxygenase-like cupin family protein
MPGKFLHLNSGEKHDLAPFFDGPWSTIERKVVLPGQSESLTQANKEIAAYVIEGKGRLEVSGRQFELEPGSAAMLLKDSTISFYAQENMELLLVSVLTSGK